MPAIPLYREPAREPARTRRHDRGHLASVLRGIAAYETARLRDGTRPWTWWLERAARHGRYGYTGTLLIAAQWRSATDVRSYEEWREAGRRVRGGETGIRVIMPSGLVRAVFDVAQTTGPLAVRTAVGPCAAEAPDPGLARARLAGAAARAGVPDTSGGLADLVHQLAHALRPGDRPGRPGSRPCQGVRRVEADSVAFLVSAWLGVEAPPVTFPDRAFWAGPGIGDRVLRVARRIYERACDPSADDVLAAAHLYFRSRLRASRVPAYLAGRGFPAAVQRRWQIGYAPPGPRALTEHLRSLGHPDAGIVAAGLACRGPGGRIRDLFRDRAMFALRTPDGAIAGFLGRRADGGAGPKYLNGPETAVFRKGELLFGLHEARDRLAAGARPVLVEGPLDAVAVTMAEPAHAAVATCGLSFTAAQFAALAAAAPGLDRTGVLVALDGDPSGRTAAVRAWATLAAAAGPVETAVLPAGHDPADLLRAGGRRALRHALRDRAPLLDAVVDAAMARAGGSLATPEARLAALRAACAVAAAHPADAARQVVRAAARADVPVHLVTGLLTDAAADAGRRAGDAAPARR